MITDQEIYDWVKSNELYEDEFGPVRKAVEGGDYLTLFQTMLGNWNWCIDNYCPIDKLECEQRANGIGLNWHWNGQPSAREEWKDGRLHGVYEVWQSDGQLRRREEWKNGKLHGVRELWHPNGQLWVQEECKDDQLHGIVEWWDENGELLKREEWKDGRRVKS
jgi:hypothetical protein